VANQNRKKKKKKKTTVELMIGSLKLPFGFFEIQTDPLHHCWGVLPFSFSKLIILPHLKEVPFLFFGEERKKRGPKKQWA
jgi:hypothetical protein